MTRIFDEEQLKPSTRVHIAQPQLAAAAVPPFTDAQAFNGVLG